MPRDQGPVHAPPAPVADAPFDAWLRQGLRRLHGAVLSEPIPDDLLRILQDGQRR